MASNVEQDQLTRIFELLHRLETRMNRIEEYLEIQPGSVAGSEIGTSANGKDLKSEDESLEFKIGEYWLAHLGTVVLMMGLAFFISYPFKTFPTILVSLIGYLAVAATVGLSHYWQKTYQYLSKILFVGGLALLYFATLRLHFFNQHPVIANKAIGLAAVVVVLAAILYLAIKRNSELLTGITLFLCYATSLVSDTTHFALLLITLTSAAAAYLLISRNWQTVAILSIVMTYATHLLWLLNNPILGKPLQAIAEPHNNLIYVFFYGTIFAMANLFRDKKSYTDSNELLLTLTNGLGFFAVSALVVLTFYKPQLAFLNLGIAVFFVALAMVNWLRHQSRFASALYTCFGNLALSIAIFSQFKSPDYFIWFGWQSLFAISLAIWFHSQIITLVNFLIYFGVFLGYWYLSPSNNFVNLSYAVAALSSARLLNWKKERLELKTDMLRNAYLASAFIIVLYGLHHAVPGKFVSLSWLGAALFYFGMSVLLQKNIKYRWMGILTIFATILRVIFVDMAKLSAEFRIILFLALGLALLTVSLIYTRYHKKTAGVKLTHLSYL